jgi:acyl carrier protein
MLRERLRTIIAAELDLPEGSVPIDASAETLEQWDSLGHMKVIMAVEQELGVRFATAEIPGLASIDKLAAALAEKGAR